MKNGTEFPLIGLVIIAVLALLLAAWNANQVNLAAAQVGTMSLGSQAPDMVGNALGLANWIFNILALILLLAVLALLGWAAWSLLRKQSARHWKAGPNAQWQGGPRQRSLSTDEVLRMYMLRQMVGGQAGQPPSMPLLQTMAEEDDAQIQI